MTLPGSWAPSCMRTGESVPELCWDHSVEWHLIYFPCVSQSCFNKKCDLNWSYRCLKRCIFHHLSSGTMHPAPEAAWIFFWGSFPKLQLLQQLHQTCCALVISTSDPLKHTNGVSCVDPALSKGTTELGFIHFWSVVTVLKPRTRVQQLGENCWEVPEETFNLGWLMTASDCSTGTKAVENRFLLFILVHDLWVWLFAQSHMMRSFAVSCRSTFEPESAEFSCTGRELWVLSCHCLCILGQILQGCFPTNIPGGSWIWVCGVLCGVKLHFTHWSCDL